jgi:hypothetical protein
MYVAQMPPRLPVCSFWRWVSQLEAWRAASDRLLAMAQTGSDAERALALASYGGVLDHVATVADPAALLLLLPAAGTLAYYLPRVEAAVQRWAAGGLAQRTRTDAHDAAARELAQEH